MPQLSGFATSSNCLSDIFVDESLHCWLRVSQCIFFHLHPTFSIPSVPSVPHSGETPHVAYGAVPLGVSHAPGTSQVFQWHGPCPLRCPHVPAPV